ncbi:hypothetical protein P9112_004746 [Eukaryota sp. TZLM1-RC]
MSNEESPLCRSTSDTQFGVFLYNRPTSICYSPPKRLSRSQIEKILASQSRESTEICRSLIELGSCKLDHCKFAHNVSELRPTLKQLGNYRRQQCTHFHDTFPYVCYFGRRCRFQHYPEDALSCENLDISSSAYFKISSKVLLPLVEELAPSIGLCEFLQGLGSESFLKGELEPRPRKRLPIFESIASSSDTSPKTNRVENTKRKRRKKSCARNNSV